MSTPSFSQLEGKRVLVTGGSGFIGGRLVEQLILGCKANVRVLVKNFSRAPRIARFALELVSGDVTDLGSVEEAVNGCDIVLHCAYGNAGDKETRRRVNVDGTRNVVAASLRAGVKRVVHLSTMMVYGSAVDGDLDEQLPRRYSKDDYADTKLDSEKYALDFAAKHGLPLAVIQPGTVYGPFAPYWTTGFLKGLKTGRIILVNGGEGLCNAVYIDDVVSAILLAAVKQEAAGEAFLISASNPVTWKEFVGSYECMLGVSSTVAMSVEEAEAYYRKSHRVRGVLGETWQLFRDDYAFRERMLRTSEIRRAVDIARALLPARAWESLKNRVGTRGGVRAPGAPQEKPIHALQPAMIRICAAKTRVRIDKAARLLGYQPAFDLDAGMKLTEKWARWAYLLSK